MRNLALNRRFGRGTTSATSLLHHHQAAWLTRSTAAALPSLMRYTRPLSVCSETRLSPSFLRMTPARKPRTECCCQSVAAIIAAIVAPAGARSMATIWACLVPGRVAGLGDAGADRLRDVGLAVFRAVERVAAFGLDLDLVMGSSEVHAAPSAAPPQPRPDKAPGGAIPKRALFAPSHHSNAPIKPESQSILSKIVAHWAQHRGALLAIFGGNCEQPMHSE